MNIHTFAKMRRTQLGLSLVELMVAMALGLLLMTGVVQVFLSSRQTYAANEAMGRLQENGRFALEFIARSARLAGYVEPVFEGGKPLALVRPSCSGLPSTIPTELCTSSGSGNDPDSVAFVFQPPITDAARRDCLGNTITENNMMVINHYSIIPATATAPAALGCRAYKFNDTTGSWTSGPSAQELISGVDSLQVLYGINTSGDARSANQYISADQVTNWNNVKAVRIAVLANSINTLTPAPAGRNFVLLDAAPITFTDNRARQIFSTTIQLKNTF
ncbi:PilW family protein [Pseudomonas sp. TMP9]|uniref:PilW family protein n=1 Tax=Pseudomonas sp. TMP9 TaxID=3133144 RepID=UPI0030D5E9CD